MEKIKLLLYCTKQKPYLVSYNNTNEHWYLLRENEKKPFPQLNSYNGKIVAECDFEVEEIKSCISPIDKKPYAYMTKTLERWDILEASCLTFDKLNDYLKGKNGYAIHIKNLKERVMELSDVCKYDTSYDNMFGWIAEENEKYIPLDKAPQNMCRVWIYENGKWVMYILISVRPEWLFKILNKEKTAEIRKRVLKGMVE